MYKRQGLAIEGDEWPETGAVIRSTEVDQDERELGRVGSVAAIANATTDSASAVALAVVRREASQPGTEVVVDTVTGPMSARIVSVDR